MTGTAGNDTISGARVDILQTWNSADTIDGGAGTDSLSAVITASVQPGVGGVTNVENLTVTNANAAAVDDLTVTFSTATQTFISGVTSITNLASTDGLTFARVTELATITLNNTVAATTVQFADAVLAGTADTVTLNVNGATGTVAIGTVSDADGDFETLNIVATGGSSAFAATNIGGDVATLNISGSGNLALGAASFANIATVAAGNATGNVSIILAADGVTGPTNTKAVTMGSGNDTVNIAALDAATVGAVSVDMGAGNDTVVIGTIANDYTINGGAGTDTLSFNALPTVATAVGVSGFEILTSTVAIADAATTTLDLAVFGTQNAISRVNVAGALVTDADGASDIFAITNARDTVTTLGINIADADGDDAIVSFARLIDGTANALTIVVTADGGGEISGIRANDEETITINTATGQLLLETMSATDMTSLVLVGANAANVGTVTAASLTRVDASALEGAFTGVFTSATGAITFTAGTGAANFTGGAGNDIINGGAGADTLVGGAGHDTIVAGNGGGTVIGGIGNDTINITNTVAIEDVIVFAEFGQGNFDVITGFTVGTAATADELTMLTAHMGWNSNGGAGAAVVATGASIGGALGATTTVVTISTNMAANSIDGLIAGTVSYAEFLSAGALAMGLTGDADAAAIYAVFVDDGKHTALFRFVSSDDGDDDATTASELEVVGIFLNVSDATALVAENLNAFA